MKRLLLALLLLLAFATPAQAMRVGTQPNSWDYGPFSWGYYLPQVQPDVVRLEVDWTAPWSELDYELSKTPPGAQVILLPLGGMHPADPNVYAQQAAAMAARYPQVTGIEVWNEPNTQGFWGSPPSAAEYAELLNAVDAATTERVIAAAPWPNGFQVVWTRDVLARTTPDAVAIHPYGSTPATVVTRVQEIRALTTLPLVVTEFGWGTRSPTCSGSTTLCVAESTQASYLRDSLNRLAALRYVTDAVVYDLRDGPTDAWDARTGLFRRDGTKKPSFYTVRDWAPPASTLTTLVAPLAPLATLRIGARHRVARGRARGCERVRVVIRRRERRRVIRTENDHGRYRTRLRIRHHGLFRVRARCAAAASRIIRFRR